MAGEPHRSRRVLLADDEAPARAVLREMIAARPHLTLVGEAMDGLEAVDLARLRGPDLLLLDVQMPRLDGFEVLELVEPSVGVVFTTAYDRYALRAFEVNAVDYLLKPFSEARFAEALERAESRLGAGRRTSGSALAAAARPTGSFATRLVIKDGVRVELLPVGDLDYARAQGDYVELVSGARSWLKEVTLQDLEAALDPARFVRLHRSYIIQGERLSRVEPVGKDSRVAVLTTGARIPISETGLARLQSWLQRTG
ncbi:MAG TPA: LytTR family DNA-binding domain-containing protein [Anaeromyxobacteraceae bacterium]|nr:LytTR family DNA-binding domain-containing protein [Anaeromyxobacteraceae bacterium]